jgi:hypothetical protein
VNSVGKGFGKVSDGLCCELLSGLPVNLTMALSLIGLFGETAYKFGAFMTLRPNTYFIVAIPRVLARR